MNDEEFIDMHGLCFGVDSAVFHLDSVIFAGVRAGLDADVVHLHVKNLARIALSYKDDELTALKILERVYCSAVGDSWSRLHSCLSGGNDDATSGLVKALDEYKRTMGGPLNLFGLENAAYVNLINNCDTNGPFADSCRVYRQQVKMV